MVDVRFTGTITVDDYWAGGEPRKIADELMTALHLNPDEVTEIRVLASTVKVTLLDRRQHTTRVVEYPLNA